MFTDYKNVRLMDGYWKNKENLNRDVVIPAVYNGFYDTGRINAFKCDWKEGMPNRPHYFWDSDVAKWIEGASYVLSREDNPELEAKIESIIDDIENNQCEDGYFNSFYITFPEEKRFNDRARHELYCAGHLMEAACAYYNATGKDRFLKLMEKYADCIEKVFVQDKSANFETPGHEEIEVALFKMYRTTDNEKYFDLAKHFLERRGQPDNKEAHIYSEPNYAQSYAPIREQHKALGHCVRATYLYSGMADLALETDDTELLLACRDLFDDTVNRKMYITGGIGSIKHGEAFTIPYDLPENRAYTETCASIGMIFFANRMFKADPLHPSKYADIIELEMYNGMLSGLSLDGEKFFYENPLEIYLEERRRLTCTDEHESWPITQRVRVFDCSCCPPNINRLLASLGEYFYAYDESKEAVYINQFGSSTFEKDNIKVVQNTDYPNNGRIEIESNVPAFVRIPGWCHSFTADKPYVMENGYARFEDGKFVVEFEIKPELVCANVRVVRNIGKAALRFGPLVYCAEGIDNQNDVHTLLFDRNSLESADVEFDKAFDLPKITLDGYRRENVSDNLYAPLEEKFEKTKIHLIPYACFANRGECDMLVYLNYR